MDLTSAPTHLDGACLNELLMGEHVCRMFALWVDCSLMVTMTHIFLLVKLLAASWIEASIAKSGLSAAEVSAVAFS